MTKEQYAQLERTIAGAFHRCNEMPLARAESYAAIAVNHMKRAMLDQLMHQTEQLKQAIPASKTREAI